MNRSSWFLYVPMVLSIVSCASTAEKSPRVSDALREVTGQNGRACVRTGEITGYGVRDSNIVNIDALGDYYIATIRPGCFDLGFSPAAAFSSDSYELCGGRMDKIIVSDDSCTVHQLFEFENREEAFATYEAALQWQQENAQEK